MPLKVVTWNMGFWTHRDVHQDAWAYLLDDLAPDIALVQEARRPGCAGESQLIWHPIKNRDGTERQWGNGVFARDADIHELVFENSHPGSLVGAEITFADGRRVTVFSMYGLLDKGSGRVGYATTTVHRMLSDLTSVLMGEGDFAGKNHDVILGGDLNISVQCDKKWGGKERYRNAHRICFDRIEDFGLVSCFAGREGYTQTLRHKRSSYPWQNDYIFLSRNLAQVMKRPCRVLDGQHKPDIMRFSDHNPVVVELELPGLGTITDKGGGTA